MNIVKFSFFFQAEDGIRDFHVTGVQTCALPIYFGALFRINGEFKGTLHRLDGPNKGRVDEVELNIEYARKEDDVEGSFYCQLSRSEERREGKVGRCRRQPTH